MKNWVKSHREEIHKWAYDSYRRHVNNFTGDTLLQAIENDVNDGLKVMRTAWSLAEDDRLYFYWCKRMNKHFHVFDHSVEDTGSQCAYCDEQQREKATYEASSQRGFRR